MRLAVNSTSALAQLRRAATAVVGVALMATAMTGSAGEVQYIAASAHNSGAAGTLWLTDARVFNPDASRSITVTLTFLPRFEDNSQATGVDVTIGPRQAAELDDLVASVFGDARPGAVRLESEAPFLATSRTYNVGDGSSGTFGQYIAAVGSDAAMARGILLQAANDSAHTGFRTNVGFVRVGPEPCTVTVKVYNLLNATLIGSGTLTVNPYGFEQVDNVFNFIGAANAISPNASVEFVADQPVIAYASVVDNTSGDAICVRALADTGTPDAANNPPDGSITQPPADVTIATGATVHFAGTASDPDGDAVTVLWDFGDGMTATELEPGDHTFAVAGVFTVTLTATDDQGLADPTPATRTITVQGGNAAPNAVIEQPAGDVSISAGQSVYFSGSASDPDGDQVTVLWDFGDGTTSTALAPGNHVYAAAGSYTVSLTATDEHGQSDPSPATRTVTVAAQNRAPNGVIEQPAGDVSVEVGQAVVFSGSASDPDGDTVTVAWDFGDGTSSTVLSPGSYTYDTAGVFTVVFVATDDKGLSDPTPDSRTITVAAPNSPPDGVITQPGGNVTVNAGQAVAFAGTVSDPDGDTVTVLWDFGDGVTSTALAPGDHTYTAAGTYTVVFTATDEHGLADPTPDTRTVTVNPAAPTLSQIQATTFTPRCTPCHGGSDPIAGQNLEAGQAYSNLVNVPATTQPGIRVIPYDSGNSVLVIQLQGGHQSVPLAEIQAIAQWIESGAPDN